MARRPRDTRLPAPFLRGLRLDRALGDLPDDYPFNLPWLTDEFELDFDTPVTILMGENGTGKSTLIETIASLAGFSVRGGGAWVGTPDPVDGGPAALADHMRASWLPKVSRGWFLRAGSFEAVAALLATDHLSVSHGEGFAGLVAERMQEQGVYLLDEPEAALSPKRQAEILGFLAEIQTSARAQVIMATHSPLLMAVPGATLLRITHREIAEV